MTKTWENNWKTYGDNLPWVVNEVQPSLIKYTEILQPKKILEIGCGDGLNSSWLEQNGYDVTSIDISESAIAIAKQKYPNIKQAYAVDIFLYETDQKYDFIFDRGCFHGNEINKPKFVEKIYNLLEPNGHWLCIAGKTTELKNGPRPCTLAVLADPIETHLEIVSVNTVGILCNLPKVELFPAWEILSKKN